MLRGARRGRRRALRRRLDVGLCACACAEGGGYEAQRRTTLVRARAVDATVQEQCAAWRRSGRRGGLPLRGKSVASATSSATASAKRTGRGESRAWSQRELCMQEMV